MTDGEAIDALKRALRPLSDNRRPELSDLIRAAADQRCEAAVPVLREVRAGEHDEAARIAAGHALFEISSEDALDALEEGREDDDEFVRFLAAKTLFARYGDQAYDRLEEWVEAGEMAVLDQVFELLGPWSFAQDGPEWMHEPARRALRSDPRWLALCAVFRRDPELGSAARHALRYADADLRDAALKQAREIEEEEAPVPLHTARDGALLRRYQQGEHLAVWREIQSHPRIGGDFRDEVLQVADATMAIVAENADLLAERLQARGWRPLGPEAIRTAPDPSHEDYFSQMNSVTGAQLPPTLLSFWRVVGGVNFVWDYNSEQDNPDLGAEVDWWMMDPLNVDSPLRCKYLLEDWAAEAADYDRPPLGMLGEHAAPDLEEPYRIDLAPDVFHKANVSGGGPYHVAVPYEGADPIFEDEPHRLPFTDYLRLAFRWAGFPGLEQHADQEDVQRFVAEFGADLRPF